MEMVRLLMMFALLPVAASAAGFALTIGPPVAAGTNAKVVKKVAALFAVRLEECPDPSKARISATAEGAVNGARSSAAALVEPAGQAGVYLVSRNWPNEGAWVVSLSATCGGAKAGAIVPIGPQGFLRDSIESFSRAPDPAEVDSALRNLDKH